MVAGIFLHSHLSAWCPVLESVVGQASTQRYSTPRGDCVYVTRTTLEHVIENDVR